MIISAKDNIEPIAVTKSQDAMNYVEDTPTFPKTENQPRINQQQVIPTSIKVRLLGDLFSNNPSSSALGSAIKASGIIPNSSSGTFLFILSDNAGRELIAVPDIAFYINNVTPDTQWPNAAFGMGNMPTSVFNDWGQTDNKNVATRATIRNNSGSSQLVYCYCRFRIIANPGPSSGSQS